MRKYLLAAVAAAAIASPAVARDGAGYVGLEGGIMFPQDWDLEGEFIFTDPELTDFPEGDVADLEFKRGLDLDVIGGYDFGMVRGELELGYKRAKLDDIEFDDDFLDAIGADTDDDFDVNGKVSVLSLMGNALLVFGDVAGFGAYVGGGFGRARVKALGDKDSAWAMQLIAGVRTALSENIDAGLKYRYFRTGRLNFVEDFADADGEGFVGSSERFKSHSLLLSLIYNFAPPAPPPPPPPPPPEPERG